MRVKTLKIADALCALCPFDLDAEKILLKHSTAQGFQERKIQVFEILLKKQKHTGSFLESLKASLPQRQRALLLHQLESRLDSELYFFIRLDKTKIMDEGVYEITDSGNCFHIKISVAAYPANRTEGLKVISSWLGDMNKVAD